MLSDLVLEHRAVHPPADLPSPDIIVQHCATVRQIGSCFQVQGVDRFWIKHGSWITLGEALTQDHVAQIVNADPASVVRVPEVYLVFSRQSCRYIVMQYIPGDTIAARQPGPGKYADGDLVAAAAAFKQLISLRMPSDTQPGHIGGGPIGHDFFVEGRSAVEYPTVGHLQAQINKLVASRGLSVDFSQEVVEGLFLCPSNIESSNFIINEKGKVFAINFGRTGYMPSSYVSYALNHHDPFTQGVARLVNYPRSPHLSAMGQAAGLLLIFDNNSLGLSTKRSSGR